MDRSSKPRGICKESTRRCCEIETEKVRRSLRMEDWESRIEKLSKTTLPRRRACDEGPELTWDGGTADSIGRGGVTDGVHEVGGDCGEVVREPSGEFSGDVVVQGGSEPMVELLRMSAKAAPRRTTGSTSEEGEEVSPCHLLPGDMAVDATLPPPSPFSGWPVPSINESSTGYEAGCDVGGVETSGGEGDDSTEHEREMPMTRSSHS
mmetsp:Transcript_6916/g.19564  ORF Transcript_6916/g.19564 Transcript_6916/m.19564 type:complete len:207 (-) Transcript_6916:89-709(-)